MALTMGISSPIGAANRSGSYKLSAVSQGSRRKLSAIDMK